MPGHERFHVEAIRPCWLLSSTLVVEASADFPLAQSSDYTGVVRKEHGWSGGGIVWLGLASRANRSKSKLPQD